MDPKRDPNEASKWSPGRPFSVPESIPFRDRFFVRFRSPPGLLFGSFWGSFLMLFRSPRQFLSERAIFRKYYENQRIFKIFGVVEGPPGVFFGSIRVSGALLFRGSFFDRFWLAPGSPGTPQMVPQTAPRRDQDAPQKTIKNWTPKRPKRDPKRGAKRDPKTDPGGGRG